MRFLGKREVTPHQKTWVYSAVATIAWKLIMGGNFQVTMTVHALGLPRMAKRYMYLLDLFTKAHSHLDFCKSVILIFAKRKWTLFSLRSCLWALTSSKPVPRLELNNGVSRSLSCHYRFASNVWRSTRNTSDFMATSEDFENSLNFYTSLKCSRVNKWDFSRHWKCQPRCTSYWATRCFNFTSSFVAN